MTRSHSLLEPIAALVALWRLRLRAVCARLLDTPTDVYGVAAAIDLRLAAGAGDGWRYAALPPDGKAYTRLLTEFDTVAHQPFVTLDAPHQAQVLATVQQGQHARAFEELLTECAELAYSHPLLQEEIGYVGMADVGGWQAIGLNERESWEPEPGAGFRG